MAILVKIQTIRLLPLGDEEVLGESYVTGNSIGDCLNSRAPNPAEGAMFKVLVVSKEVING